MCLFLVTPDSARPTKIRKPPNQPAGSARTKLSGGRIPKGKGRQRGNVRPKSVWAARGFCKGRDRWGGPGMGRPPGASVAPRLPRVLPALVRSRRAAAEATQASNSCARPEARAARPGLPTKAALPLGFLVFCSPQATAGLNSPQRVPFRTMAFRMARSLRMQAVRATFLGFPALHRRL